MTFGAAGAAAVLAPNAAFASGVSLEEAAINAEKYRHKGKQCTPTNPADCTARYNQMLDPRAGRTKEELEAMDKRDEGAVHARNHVVRREVREYGQGEVVGRMSPAPSSTRAVKHHCIRPKTKLTPTTTFTRSLSLPRERLRERPRGRARDAVLPERVPPEPPPAVLAGHERVLEEVTFRSDSTLRVRARACSTHQN